MEYQEEHGEWVTLKRREDGCWVETVYAKDESGAKVVARVKEFAADGEDRLLDWYSRTWDEVVGSGDLRHYDAGTRVEKLREPNGVRFYVSKYIAKVDEAEVLKSPHCLRRWWGVKGRRFIPWGKRVVFECTKGQAAKLKGGSAVRLGSYGKKVSFLAHDDERLYQRQRAVVAVGGLRPQGGG